MPAGIDRAIAAPALLRLRFSSMRRRPDRVLGIIDDLNGTGRPYADIAALPGVIPRGAPVYVSGWLYGPDADGPPEIVITVDGAFAGIATAGFARPDVAALHGAGAANCGFHAVLPSKAIAEGLRTFAAVQLIDAMTYRVGPERPIVIARSALRTEIATPVDPGVYVYLDRFVDGTQPPATPDGVPEYGARSTIGIIGWAADLSSRQPCAAVYALVDGVHVFRGRYGAERADVASAHDAPQLRFAGYEIRIDAGALEPGLHDVRVIALSAGGEGRSEGTPAQPFAVLPD